jgi:hypothetical protein
MFAIAGVAVIVAITFIVNYRPTQPQRIVVPSNTEQVKLLFDYTKFHIGLYSTLATVVISILVSQRTAKWPIWPESLTLAVLCLVSAGLAGGVIASSLPHLFGCYDVKNVLIGPIMCEHWPLVFWTYVEHCAFWAAVFFVILAFSPAMLGKRVEHTAEPHRVIIVGSAACPHHGAQQAVPHSDSRSPEPQATSDPVG